jgi:Fic family protein
MYKQSFKILPTDLWEEYRLCFPPVKSAFEQLKDSELSIDTFHFYTSVSAVFSSKIEGEDIEMDTFIKHKRLGVAYKPDYTRKIDDLYNAYLLAQKNKPNPQNIALVHAELTKNILQPAQQGKFRTGNMFVVSEDSKIEYIAVTPNRVVAEMEKVYEDLEYLIQKTLTFEESFFYASWLHLVLVKVHPFNDGNGRMARLLEKWFLAEKLGEKAWFIQSERYYYEHHPEYYNCIRRLGLEYDLLDYSKALPFLQQLPLAVNFQER